MAGERRVIRWNGRDDREALLALHDLPPGEYVLVPVSDGDKWDLSADDEADLEHAVAEAEAGELVDADVVHDALRARIDR